MDGKVNAEITHAGRTFGPEKAGGSITQESEVSRMGLSMGVSLHSGAVVGTGGARVPPFRSRSKPSVQASPLFTLSFSPTKSVAGWWQWFSNLTVHRDPQKAREDPDCWAHTQSFGFGLSKSGAGPENLHSN